MEEEFLNAFNHNYITTDTTFTTFTTDADNLVFSGDTNYIKNEPTVNFCIGDKNYDIRSIILLLKVLMNKEGLSEKLLTMDYDKLVVMMGREMSIDTLLK